MTTVYKFKAYYTDAGVGTVQDPAPTCTVINMADDSKLADAQATTASTNMPGLYSYEYSGADGLDCVALFATTDTGCDVKQLASYVSEKITTNLNADVAGVETKLDTVDTNVDAILADTGTDGVLLSAGTGAKQISLSSGAVLLQATQTGVTIPTVTTLTNLPSIPNNWITAAGIATGAIDADAIADNAIDAGAIASNAIAAAKIATGAITNAKFAAGAIDAAAIADNAIDAGAIATGAITNAKFAAGAIDAAAIATDAIDADSVKADAVTKIQTGLATPTNITAGTITTATNLTNLPAVPTDWLTAAGIKADAVTKIQAGLAPSSDLAVVSGYVDELETRLTAARAGYLDKLNVSGTLAHSDAAATYKADVSGLMTAGAYVAPDNATIASISSTLGTGVALTAAGVDAILDEVVVGTYTMRQLLTVMGSALAGKLSGGGTTTLTFRGINDASNVIVATVDANGNRSDVTVTV